MHLKKAFARLARDFIITQKYNESVKIREMRKMRKHTKTHENDMQKYAKDM